MVSELQDITNTLWVQAILSCINPSEGLPIFDSLHNFGSYANTIDSHYLRLTIMPPVPHLKPHLSRSCFSGGQWMSFIRKMPKYMYNSLTWTISQLISRAGVLISELVQRHKGPRHQVLHSPKWDVIPREIPSLEWSLRRKNIELHKESQ